MDTKFGTNVSNRMLLNAAKFQCYSIYRFWVIEGEPRAVKLPHDPTQIRVKVTKNVNSSNYKYSGYNIWFDGKGTFSFQNSSFGTNAIIFGVYMSSSVHVDYKKKYILIPGERPTQD